VVSFFTVAAALFGLLIGSFLNVVAYRVPLGKSVVSPPSACPNCAAEIRWYDNLPVVSWLLLRARCRNCGEPISWRYPAVEALTAGLFALTAFVLLDRAPAAASGLPTVGTTITVVAYLYLAAVSVALALIDLDTQRLPNAIVYPSYVVGATLLTAATLFSGDWAALLTAAIAGAALFLAYLLLVLVYPGGMGLGDVKLAGVLGLYLGYLGWGAFAVGAFAPFLLGGLFAIVLVLLRRAGGKSRIPFGPWMLLGAWVGIVFGGGIWNWYLGFVGLV
jgi:leader peptidase (prepilin peptidase)/N-methyltransferase